jgi:hypothetical protein
MPVSASQKKASKKYRLNNSDLCKKRMLEIYRVNMMDEEFRKRESERQKNKYYCKKEFKAFLSILLDDEI